jgi:DNA replication protein DnaC
MTTQNLALVDNAKEKQEECEKHGAFTSTATLFKNLGLSWSECPGCEAARREWRRAQEAADAQREFEQVLRYANIPQRFCHKSLADYEAKTDSQRKVLSIAKEYAENFDEHYAAGRCLIFSGRVGVGKTHLAVGICREIISKPFAGPEWRSAKSHSCRYTTASAMIRDVRETWGKRELSESDALRKYTRPHLLVIDEVGRQYGSDAEKLQIEELLDLRYQDKMPTIICTNVEKSQLPQFLGERGLDRLRENGGLMAVCDWASHRV